MKKMIPLLLCLSMLLTVCAVTVPTAALNDSVNDSTWSEGTRVSGGQELLLRAGKGL